MNRHILLLLTCLIHQTVSFSQSFTVVPLGVKGGLDESNLSAYMVAAKGTNEYICLDAGTLYSGIRKAVELGTFPPPASEVLRNTIKGYFISHPHLDHVAGLIINSPDDSSKNIYGLPACLSVLKDKYFSWQSWANFADDGEKPLLKKYHYVTLQPEQEIAAERTPLYIRAWPLSHGKPYESTAFLVRSRDNYLLYLGDTGADTIEQSHRLYSLWMGISPLVRAGKLKAIFIETSFPNEQPDKLLFGHLTPKLLMQEMQALEKLAGTGSLKGLPVVITHQKPTGNQEERIRGQLEADNRLQVRLVFPEQGKRMDF
ncbi:MAG TPA: 3',5'-cyclic-nucleotide phosphodiesterase [Puia sp.]|jgi:3',5'-cyclic-nucleotide phosphodiesterase